MSTVKITVRPSTPRASVQVVELDRGVRIGLRCQYSKAQDRWMLWVLDLDLTQIAGPIALVPGIDILQPLKGDARVPQGELFVYSPTRTPPGLEEIDSEALLVYRRPAS